MFLIDKLFSYFYNPLNQKKEFFMNKKVSVIIPIYNIEKYLKECLDSVSEQTYKNLQIICIDDGTLDKSCDIVIKMMQKDPRIQLINKVHKGLGSARNAGLQYATGDYVLFVDGDDLLNKKTIETFVSLSLQTNADVVCGQFKGFGAENMPIDDDKKVSCYVTDKPMNLYLKKKPDIAFSVWNKLFKTETLKGRAFLPDIYYEDFPFVYSVFKEIKTCVVCDMISYYYRQDNPSIMRSPVSLKKINDFAKATAFVYHDFSFKNKFDELDKLFKYSLFRMYKYALYLTKDDPQYRHRFRAGMRFFKEMGLLPYQEKNVLKDHLRGQRLIQSRLSFQQMIDLNNERQKN